MRFGRASHATSEDMGNNPVETLGNEDEVQMIHHLESGPFQTIGTLSDRDLVEEYLPEFAPLVRVRRINRDPFLRFGRAVPYLRFGKRNFPYLRFGRNSPAVEAFSSFGKTRQALHQPDDDVTILTGSAGLGEESFGAARKKRSVVPSVEEAETEVKGCVCGTDSNDWETTNANLDLMDTRATRGNPYMRFGKKSDQQNSGTTTKNQADKRKQEYMRFGRANEVNTL